MKAERKFTAESESGEEKDVQQEMQQDERQDERQDLQQPAVHQGKPFKHIFAVPAYGDSPYLAECLTSLKNQGDPSSEVIVCTSTPSGYIRETAGHFGIGLIERDGKPSLGADWNFCMEQAVLRGAEYVTIAHQDDVYHRDYTDNLRAAAEKYPDLSLFCTRYRTIDGNGRTIRKSPEGVKRILRLPLRMRLLADRTAVKKAALRFGNSICCPSCTYAAAYTGTGFFDERLSFVPDWKALLELAGKPGRFICIEKELLDYRVHELAATKACIKDDSRSREERDMFSTLWPAPVTALIMKCFKKAGRVYDV